MTHEQNRHLCPYCQTAALETVATLPYVRGRGLGADFNMKTISGCNACVRKQLLLETLRSSVDGWASPAALITNPVLLTYGLARAAVVRRNEKRVGRMLKDMGVAGSPDDQNPVRIAYNLAAALIAADGKVYEVEVTTAARIGKQLFADFNEEDFYATITSSRDLPAAEEIATMLKRVVSLETRDTLYRYLLAIAAADQEVAAEEQEILMLIAKNLGLTGPGHGVDQSV